MFQRSSVINSNVAMKTRLNTRNTFFSKMVQVREPTNHLIAELDIYLPLQSPAADAESLDSKVVNFTLGSFLHQSSSISLVPLVEQWYVDIMHQSTVTSTIHVTY